MVDKEQGKILVVDDEPYISQLLARYLEGEGYDCETASSAEEAMKMLEADEFHLLISDIIMPGISGIDLLTIVRPLYPDLAVIMVTAVDDRDTGILAIDLGAYGYVIKPFERNEILINVASALERRRLAMLAQNCTIPVEMLPRQKTLKRQPIKIPTEEVANLVRSGIEEKALMQKFNLSAKALHSLLDQLVSVGALDQSEIDQRNSLSPGTVAIEINQVGFPEGKKQRPVISAADAAKSIRSGMDDPSLMEKYGISAKGLRSLFRKLVAAGVMQQWELDKRMSETQSWAVLDD